MPMPFRDERDTQLLLRSTEPGDAGGERLRVLFERMNEPMSRVAAVNLPPRSADVDSVVSEAFYEACVDPARKPPDRTCRSWLLAFVTMSCKRAQRNRRGPGRLPEEDPPAEGGDPADPLHRSERAAQLEAALRALPQEEREVLELRFGSGLAANEIADKLGIAPNTVTARTQRGLARMRQALGADFANTKV